MASNGDFRGGFQYNGTNPSSNKGPPPEHPGTRTEIIVDSVTHSIVSSGTSCSSDGDIPERRLKRPESQGQVDRHRTLRISHVVHTQIAHSPPNIDEPDPQ